MGRFFTLVLWVSIAFSGFLLIQLSIPYLAFERNVDFLKTKQLIYHHDLWRWSFYIHVFSSPIAFLAALAQFFPLVQHRIVYHKLFGIVFFISFLLLAGPSGLVLGIYANGGFWAQMSFSLLSLLWLFCGIQAYWMVRRKKYVQHQKWVLRCLFLMLSAIMLRLYAYFIAYFNLDIHPKTAYIMIAWLSWVPNLIIGEIFLRTNSVQRFLQQAYSPS
ncbi:MAG: DUF2306 domain-containing protein [Crocinitomicaceae bacterium]|jgi:hypothetical protein|nr:DUF2306 domain-containing protein [Crocinitomicaceae bacterium]